MTQTARREEKNNLVIRNLEINLRKKLMECYIWSIALHVAENWALWKVDRKYLESFEMKF
jgi:regulator of sirC expression with transglutaminase-like and TPR domain